jgi:CRP/FNR family transcriptional regulator
MRLPTEWNQIFEPGLLQEIKVYGIPRSLQYGETLIKAGQTVRIIPIVAKGILKVSRLDESGRELLLYYINANESCAMTFTCCMQIFPSQVSTVAEDETDIIAIPVDKMDKWMAAFPTWKSFVMNTIRNRFNELLQTIDQIAFQKLDERLIAYLKEKANATGSTLINLSHEQIATEMASTREVISRLLKKLENEKRVLLYRKQIKLMNEL